MKNIFLIFFLSFSFSFFGQNEIEKDPVPIIDVKLFNTNYKEFEVFGNDVYAITKGDSLVRFNLLTNTKLLIENNVISFSKTTTKKLIIVKKNGQIINLDNNRNVLDNINEKVYFIKSINDSSFIAVTEKGIYLNKNYYKSKNNYRIWKPKDKESKDSIFIKPTSIFKSKDKLWLNFEFGESGSSLLIFDINEKAFNNQNLLSGYWYEQILGNFEYKNQIDEYLKKEHPYIFKNKNSLDLLFPNGLPVKHIKGIAFDDKNAVFFSQSLIHFLVSGDLFKIETYVENEKEYYKINSVSKVLEMITNENKTKSLNEYIGTCSYNNFNNSFYYYSDKGFFKIIEKEDKTEKELFFKPNLKWDFGLSNALGYQMNVLKFEFISENEMIFLTSNNGIGYFNGTKVKYFQ